MVQTTPKLLTLTLIRKFFSGDLQQFQAVRKPPPGVKPYDWHRRPILKIASVVEAVGERKVFPCKLMVRGIAKIKY